MRPRIALLVVALLLLPVSPASAKFFHVDTMTISGPGLDGPLVLRQREFFVRRTRSPGSNQVFRDLFGATAAVPHLPLLALGPGYRIEYRLAFFFEEQRSVTVVQELFPFAQGGPVVYTPDQRLDIEFPDDWQFEPLHAPADWTVYPERPLRKLFVLGLPSTPPLVKEEESPTSPSPTRSATYVAFALGALYVLRGLVYRSGGPGARGVRHGRPSMGSLR